MNKSKIEWVDFEWNPVTGCKDVCAYCFGRLNAKNFSGEADWNISKAKHYMDPDTGMTTDLLLLEEPLRTEAGTILTYPYGFAPTYTRSRLTTPERWKMTRNILVCAESELFGDWIPTSVIREVMDACKKYPQHHYLFLTRHPERYLQLAQAGILPDGDHFWYGVTVNKGANKHISDLAQRGYHTYQVSEPLQGNAELAEGVEWLIIGPERGKRADKEQIETSWVINLITQAKIKEVPVFLSKGLPLPAYIEDKSMPEALTDIRPGKGHEKKLLARCISCGEESKKSQMITLSVNHGRGSLNRTMGWWCEECFEKFCTEHNMEIPDLRAQH